MSQQINLYEERLRPRLEIVTGRNLGMAAVLLLVLMGGWSVWSGIEAARKTAEAAASLKEVEAVQEAMKTLSQAVALRKVSPALAADVGNAKSMVTARKDVIEVLDSGVLGNTSGFSAFMDGFARQAQTDLWLTGFQITDGGEEIEIRGRMLDPASLPAYVQRLNSVPVFQGRRFAALEMRRVVFDDLKVDQSVPGIVSLANSQVPSSVNSPNSPSLPNLPSLPPVVEFVLRSEHVGGAESSLRAKEAP